MTRHRLLLAVLSAAIVLPAAAQEQSDKTRLDDFAVPRVEAGLGVQQVGGGEQAALSAAQEREDRQLVVPGPPPVAAQPIAQLSSNGGAEPTTQLSGQADSKDLVAAGASSPADSRPEAVTRFSGEDRCDPQQNPAQLARCRQILELRAAEFDAPAPPKMSAEQVLLIERGETLELLASTSSDLRARLAGSDDPSADNRTNQELASIYFDTPSPPQPEAATMGIDPTLAEGLAETIEGLQSLPAPGQSGRP